MARDRRTDASRAGADEALATPKVRDNRRPSTGNRQLFLVLALLTALAANAAAAPTPIALWVWEAESFRLLDDATWRNATTATLQSKGISTLYLYGDSWHGRLPIRDEQPALRALVSTLHRQGFVVYALLGSADLHTEEYARPEKRAEAMAMFQRVLDFNAAAKGAERFDGINLDIEPYLTPEWDTNRAGVLLQYLDLTDAFMTAKRTAGSTIAIGPAMPFWWDDVLTWHGETRPMHEFVQTLYDYVAIMDYRDHADGGDGIIDHALAEVAFGEKAGRRVVIGVDVGPGDVDKLSFRQETETYMRAELEKVRAHYATSPAFSGFAIHHMGTYLTWCCGKRRAAGK